MVCSAYCFRPPKTTCPGVARAIICQENALQNCLQAIQWKHFLNQGFSSQSLTCVRVTKCEPGQKWLYPWYLNINGLVYWWDSSSHGITVKCQKLKGIVSLGEFSRKKSCYESISHHAHLFFGYHKVSSFVQQCRDRMDVAISPETVQAASRWNFWNNEPKWITFLQTVPGLCHSNRKSDSHTILISREVRLLL